MVGCAEATAGMSADMTLSAIMLGVVLALVGKILILAFIGAVAVIAAAIWLISKVL